ncbi:hypothetical protein PAXRUDRAFT_169245 [Paxillus rubicundulus Ve08.2h10]|uniref:Uncharacterized protein n=1 Tax=Paxillus rubicundulus Ve08.2h10 TaxID=930991 RepID=A0A0D0CMV8_9AGAM|nr:hypothetical protein PAXRUDRAFT_169245 [Paxillus rubicundulus Ve08.2h10]
MCNCTYGKSKIYSGLINPIRSADRAIVFTFKVLDDFLQDDVECGTAAMNYFSKLKRITSNVFLHLVLVIFSVRYGTCLGELVLFCPASVIELQYHDIMATLEIPFSELQNYYEYLINEYQTEFGLNSKW